MLGAAIVTLVAILLLWMWGGRTFTFGSEVLLAAPPEQVFPYLTEPALLTQWMGGLVESRPLDDGVLRVGARAREVVEENGKRFEMESEVVGLEPNRTLEVSLRHPSMECVNRYQLEPEDSHTRVTMTMRLSGRGFMRLMAPFIGGPARRKLDADFGRLKELLEAR
jgi:uncharacterized protein YndB with AHSA1/START domain